MHAAPITIYKSEVAGLASTIISKSDAYAYKLANGAVVNFSTIDISAVQPIVGTYNFTLKTPAGSTITRTVTVINDAFTISGSFWKDGENPANGLKNIGVDYFSETENREVKLYNLDTNTYENASAIVGSDGTYTITGV